MQATARTISKYRKFIPHLKAREHTKVKNNMLNAPIASYIFSDRILRRQKKISLSNANKYSITVKSRGEGNVKCMVTVMCPIRHCFGCRLIPCESSLFCFDISIQTYDVICMNNHAESHALKLLTIYGEILHNSTCNFI